MLVAISIAVAAAAMAMPWSGPLASVFGFVALPAGLAATSIAVVLAYVVATEAAKRRFYRAG